MIKIQSSIKFDIYWKQKDTHWVSSKAILSQIFPDNINNVIVRVKFRGWLKCSYFNDIRNKNINEIINVDIKIWQSQNSYCSEYTEFCIFNKQVIDLTELEILQCNASMHKQGILTWKSL